MEPLQGNILFVSISLELVIFLVVNEFATFKLFLTLKLLLTTKSLLIVPSLPSIDFSLLIDSLAVKLSPVILPIVNELLLN